MGEGEPLFSPQRGTEEKGGGNLQSSIFEQGQFSNQLKEALTGGWGLSILFLSAQWHRGMRRFKHEYDSRRFVA